MNLFHRYSYTNAEAELKLSLELQLDIIFSSSFTIHVVILVAKMGMDSILF